MQTYEYILLPHPLQHNSYIWYISFFPIWTCDTSTFTWTYAEKETCLILEGDITVTPNGGEPVSFGVGDLVIFPEGMSCTWEVHKAVRKHYRFGN